MATPGEAPGPGCGLGVQWAADLCLPPSVPSWSSYVALCSPFPASLHYWGILIYFLTQAARKEIWVCSPRCHRWAL